MFTPAMPSAPFVCRRVGPLAVLMPATGRDLHGRPDDPDLQLPCQSPATFALADSS